MDRPLHPPVPELRGINSRDGGKLLQDKEEAVALQGCEAELRAPGRGGS